MQTTAKKRGEARMLTGWTGSLDTPSMLRVNFSTDAASGLFTLRTGGVSTTPFDTLNLGFHVKDDPLHVQENRRICATFIGGALEDFVVPEQVHGNGVATVGIKERGMGSSYDSTPVEGVDAVVTNEPGLTLAVLSADCIPILFFDKEQRVVGAAHSGWKGTVSHIARNVISTMQREYGSLPSNIEVWLGPSIRRCCYEVDERVALPIQQEFGRKPLIPRQNRNGKFLLSLQSCVRMDLEAVGVASDRIHDVGVCTSCRTNALFSHRAEHGRTGRFMGLVRLREGK